MGAAAEDGADRGNGEEEEMTEGRSMTEPKWHNDKNLVMLSGHTHVYEFECINSRAAEKASELLNVLEERISDLEARAELADEARKAVASWAGGQQVFPAMSRHDARDWLARYDALQAALAAKEQENAELRARLDMVEEPCAIWLSDLCGECKHEAAHHGEESTTQLPWATEYFPECRVDGCGCAEFVPADRQRLEAMVEAAEARAEALATTLEELIDSLGLCVPEPFGRPFCIAHAQRMPCDIATARAALDAYRATD